MTIWTEKTIYTLFKNGPAFMRAYYAIELIYNINYNKTSTINNRGVFFAHINI